jgi:Ser/Thr protein kinase RdoA (MazF antagonist)
MTQTWTKTYPTPHAARAAAAHYDWTSDTGQLQLPDLLLRDETSLVFTYVNGRHVQPADLRAVARALARFHAAAHQHLGGVPAGRPHRTHSGLTIPGFSTRRAERLQQALTSPERPATWLTPEHAAAWMERAEGLPAAVYKDANVRNFLLTDTAIVGIDFDTLTLAPLGYDLAKLLISAVMTHGPIAETVLEGALAAYNDVLAAADLRGCTAEEFAAWSEIHHVLTSPYQGINGYQHRWTSTPTHS